MKNEKTITNEFALYALIFLAALGLRMVQLGRPPLLESEADWAFQALRLVRGESIPIPPRVAYLSITGGLFSLFGASDYLARFWPALTGSLVVWLPWLLKKDLGRIPALVLAAGLALDPTLVPVSRLAGGPITALVFLALAAGAFHVRKIPWAIFFTGMGLFSGPGFWMGAVLLGIGTLVGRALDVVDFEGYFQDRLAFFKGITASWLEASLLSLLALLIIGSFFLGEFQGLSAWAGALPEFMISWKGPADTEAARFLVYFLLNNPLALVFGTLGFISAWRSGNRPGRLFSIWFGAALVGLLIYPGRETADLIWLSIPLWGAAASELVRLSDLARGFWATRVMAAVVVVLGCLNWLTFTGMVFQVIDAKAIWLELGLAAASLALIALSAAVVSSEWGWDTARKGLAGGFAAALSIFMISSLVLDTYLLEKDPRSIFPGGVGASQVELLMDSIADTSISETGRPDSIRGAVIGESDVLRWALRDYEGFDFLNTAPEGPDYPILVTIREDDLTAVEANYRGQDFVFNTQPGWNGALPDDPISWIAFRRGPIIRDHLILWVRNDIYSGY